MTILLRIARPEGGGMWYNKAGEYHGFISKMTEALSGQLPMPYDPAFRDGFIWVSAVPDLESLLSWFSLKDIKELVEAGYRVYEFVVPKKFVGEANGHPIFVEAEVERVADITERVITAAEAISF